MGTQTSIEHCDIVRSSIWFADGGTVLQAEDTQFCVHDGVLSMHSVVFRDMLAESHDKGHSDLVERVDGRPLVRVSDTAEDMTFLLQALYDPS